jgi:hypothetical protein
MPQTRSLQATLLDAVDVPTGGLALLAFVMALYVLAARDQKTPYITNSVYSTAIIVLSAIFSSTLGKIIQPYYYLIGSVFRIVGLVIFLVGIANVLFSVWHVRNRKLNFRDDRHIKSLKVIRFIKHQYRKLLSKPSYEHQPVPFSDLLLTVIEGCTYVPKEQFRLVRARIEVVGALESSLSATYHVVNFSQANHVLAEFAICFLEQNCWVQYTSCVRHPIEFISHLKNTWQKGHKDRDWMSIAGRIVTADVYTPHFGFTDSIHDTVTDRMKTDLGVTCITAKASYAGLHSAAAKAFNLIKAGTRRESNTLLRVPTLVIYEGPRGIVDLESLEQYRIFIRHLLPSERLWGGMFTIVLESGIRPEELSLLKSYADLYVDFSNSEEQRDELTIDSYQTKDK